MAAIDGALARKLDFGELPTRVTSTTGRGRAGLRLAVSSSAVGPDKYVALAARRRRAQMKARRLLDAIDLDTTVQAGSAGDGH